MAEMNNNLVNEAVEAIDAKEVVEAVEKKSNDLLKTVLTFAAGTGVGAGAVVLGRKLKQAVTESKDEIKEEQKKAQIEKLQKKMADAQKKLDELTVEEPEESEVKEASKKKTTK